MHDDIHPTPLGLLRCLQVLAEEASSLHLNRTYTVLQEAIAACRAESAIARKHLPLLDDTAFITQRPPPVRAQRRPRPTRC